MVSLFVASVDDITLTLLTVVSDIIISRDTSKNAYRSVPLPKLEQRWRGDRVWRRLWLSSWPS